MQAIGIDESELKRIVWSLEKHSNHPIARTLASAFRTNNNDIRWSAVEEIKGLGMQATDREGNRYAAGSYALAQGLTDDRTHQVYVLRNGALVGWIDLDDTPRPEAREVISHLRSNGIRTILLSGDTKERCAQLAGELGMDEWHAEQSPAQKMEKIRSLRASVPTAMVGDGINDAPALAEATVGISLSDASQLAMQNAQVVLMNQGLRKLPLALGLGKHTYRTIQQNLFWAFFYNIVAIPVAAFGFLTPAFGALVMGLSDVVLAINSVRLFVKKVV
jgi:Cu+-exporting ATPase